MHARTRSHAVVRRTWFTLSAFVGLAAVASATDWYVDQSYSSCSQSDGSAGKPWCSIGGALKVAQAGDTIHVAKGIYYERVNLAIDLTLIGTDGAAKTILRTSAAIVSVNHADVSIEGFTIENGGPGLEATNGATLTVADCIVAGNVTNSVAGAGLQSDQGSAVTITGTTFTYNSASGVVGGGIWASGGSCTIRDCVFDDNDGGAILAVSGVTLTVESSTFKNHPGNAIHLESPATAAVIAGCTFVNNDEHPGLGGGAIYADTVASVDISDSTFDSNTGWFGGALRTIDSNSTCERCTFHANEATVPYYSSGGRGGAVYASTSSSTSLTFSDCVFDSNFADALSGLGSGAGAMSLESGPASLVRCRFVGNASHGAKGLGGGALFAGGTLNATDCEFTGNVAYDAFGLVAGPGAILVNGSTSNPATLERCTVGGNTTSGSGGGLVIPSGGTIYLSHTIVAGNIATGIHGVSDVEGFVTSRDWNDFGDSTGLSKILGPNDLLDVDPLFVDPSNGDYSLQSTSPCVDSGDPTATPSGPDVGGNPRLLDGDLDGLLVLDRGAREFNNVHLDVSGTPTPGGTLTLTTTGTSGLPVLLIAGAAPGELFVHPLGALFIDLTQPFLIVPFGTIPNSQNVTIDPSLPAPVSFWLQEAAFGAGAGNLSNVVSVEVQ